ncbi:PAS domain-containing protein [candidate division GN15 bacterium]|nr:PAS domain-containing protein [candidate division GN15 bacterium]
MNAGREKPGNRSDQPAGESPPRSTSPSSTPTDSVPPDSITGGERNYPDRETETRYRLLADKALDMISHHAPDGTYLWVSPSANTLLGYEPGELVGTNAYDYFHPDDLAEIQRSHTTIMRGTRVYTVQYRIRRANSSYVWFETNSAVVRDETGDITEIIAISRDISDRKAYEQALRKSEERLKAAQELGRMGNWELDVATLGIEWSEEVYRLFDRDPAVGPPSFEETLNYYTPEDRARVRECLRQAIETANECALDLEVNLPSGRSAVLATLVRVSTDDRGRVVRLYGTVQDITDRKAVERELAEINDRLQAEQQALERKNTALHEVLEQIEHEKEVMLDRVRDNLDQVVMPLLRSLEDRVGAAERELVGLVRGALSELSSPLVHELKALAAALSPRELEICSMIRSGMSSKEIAAALSTSEGTVRNQRKSIRRKLGIDHEQVNLRLFLQELDQVRTRARPKEWGS